MTYHLTNMKSTTRERSLRGLIRAEQKFRSVGEPHSVINSSKAFFLKEMERKDTGEQSSSARQESPKESSGMRETVWFSLACGLLVTAAV